MKTIATAKVIRLLRALRSSRLGSIIGLAVGSVSKLKNIRRIA
jgi:hypothetical protein